MAMKAVAFLAALAAAWAGSAQSAAYSDQATATGGGSVEIIDLQAHRRSNHGKLDACEITYLVAFEDHIYRQGAVTGLRGALSMMGFTDQKDKQPAMILKVTAFDVVNNKPIFAPLDYVFLSANGESFAGKEFVKFACEDGGVCVGYTVLDHPGLANVSNSFEINLTRPNGNSDVTVPMNVLQANPKVFSDYTDCTLELIEAVLKKSQN